MQVYVPFTCSLEGQYFISSFVIKDINILHFTANTSNRGFQAF